MTTEHRESGEEEMNTDERKLTTPIRRHHPLNREWWTPIRTVVIGATALCALVIYSFAAKDLIDSRCQQPAFEKRAERWYAPKHKFDSIKNANAQFKTAIELMKMNNGMEVLLTEEERNVRDVKFKHDSITYVQGQKGE